jgi:hypothetical protein
MTLVIGAVPAAGAPVAERRIFVESMFDEAAACVLGCMLKGDERTVLDFSRARAVDDAALAHLVRAAGGAGAPEVLLCGLDHHHERLLSYLGAKLAKLPAAGEDTGDDDPWGGRTASAEPHA